MRRTLGRAYQRLQGNHPRRPNGERAMELFCDALLLLGVLALPAGVALIVWGVVASFEPLPIVVGATFAILSPFLLFLWEQLAWEPFSEHLSRLS